MATKMVSLRLDEGLLEWAEEYAVSRGSSRSAVLSGAIESFRAMAQGGVPDLPEPAVKKPKPRVRPNVPGVITARELVMRQRQERVNRGSG